MTKPPFAPAAVTASLAAALLLLSGCFEDGPGAPVEASATLDATAQDTAICPPGKDCPCQVDADCASGLCLTLPDGSKRCARPCDDGCGEGWEQNKIEVPNPKHDPEDGGPGAEPAKISVCYCTPKEVKQCLPSPETCDGEDNDCDGDTDEDLCDDGNPCTANACDPALATDLADGCTATNLTSPCDDDNPCTVGDTCAAGACVEGGAKDCDDDSACTADTCDPDSGDCDHAPIEGPCDDGTVCTQGDACSPQGVCLPGPTTSCEDDNPCTDDGCDPQSGCFNNDNGAACDDGDPCTPKDACLGGTCVPGKEMACDDGNPCTANVCDPALVTALADGCTATKIGGVCDDGDACTAGDTCADGACVPGALEDCDDGNPCTDDGCHKETGDCQHIPKATGTACDDGDPCTASDACSKAGTCDGDPKLCDDGKGCSIDICDKNTGECTWENNSGASCEDGNGCTLGDACVGGSCVSGKTKLCDDSKPCTDDSCDPLTGACVFKPNAAPCDDGNPCTQKDQCAGGGCVGAKPVVCEDGNTCTKQWCDTASGKCQTLNVPDNVICTDADLCSEGDACKKGVCTAGPSKYCDDDEVCTDNACDPKTGACVFSANTAACEDGSKCTGGDKCKAGKCAPGPNTCECLSDAECAGKEDGDKCNGTLYCDLSSHTCKVDGNTVVVCDPTKNTTCTTFVCNSKTGGCEGIPQKDGKPCDADKSICTGGDKCVTGVCEPGKAMKCDDLNPCTSDTCHPLKGCQHEDNAAPCFDGDMCTVGDLCKGGECVAGPVKDCDDKDPCTTDSCNLATGNCQFAAASGASCEDGNACTHDELCVKGACTAQSSTKCEDGNACTLDTCDTKTGKCGSAPAFDGLGCEDGKKCTIGDACKAGKCMSGGLVGCWDGSPCTKDTCNPATGDCVHAPVNDGKACNDGDACTLADICAKGACVPKDKTPCDDKNKCTADTCNKITGVCIYKPIVDGTPCDDGDLCTLQDACYKGKCTPAKTTLCADGNPCTNDACTKSTGKCAHVFNAKWCSDGNKCTANDRCKKGKCTGKKKSCADGNQCTLDSCNPAKGCQHKPLGNVGCNDGNACTTGDNCSSGTCKGVNKVCNDNNPCTNDGCNVKLGCKFHNNTKPCNDGNKCTIKDRCKGGSCSGGVPKSCSDGNACTLDKCDPVKNCVHTVNDKAACSDGQPCTTGDKCVGGKCVGQAPTSCDDKNVCTKDTCDPIKGCQHQSLDNVPCDDNSKCTPVEKCVLGKCTPAGLLTCDDNNACTKDACDPLVGCVHAATAAACDDGDACTEKEACLAGQCTGGAKVDCDDDNLCTDDTCDAKAGCVYTEAKKTSQAKMAVRSDIQVQSWEDTKLVGGKPVPVNVQAAVPAWDGHPSWTAVIPGATWVWRTAKVADPTKTTTVSFRRTFELPPTSKKVGGLLQVAADDSFVCELNGKTVVSHQGPGGPSSVQIVNIGGVVLVGANALTCVVTNPGMPLSTPEQNPAGLLFGLDLTFEIDKQTCDDGNACTSLDLCEKGQCTGQNGLNCNDGNACTADSCDPKTGCVQVAMTGTGCDDGNACTAGDKCALGVCKTGALSACDDGNLCTVDTCDGAKGCLYVEKKPGVKETISFGSDAKTQVTTWLQIIAGKPVPVGLKPATPTWSGHPQWVKLAGASWIWTEAKVSNPEVETVAHFVRTFDVPAGTEAHAGVLKVAADDTFDCHLNEVLVGATDKGDASWKQLYALDLGSALKPGKNTLRCRVTNLGKPGLTATTGPAGLLFALEASWYKKGESLQCDDGNACTKSDTCAAKACKAGPPLGCDDDNACTTDACEPKGGVGCVHANADGNPCNDGSVCTQQDLCKGGKCGGSKPVSCDDGNACTTDGCDGLKGCVAAPVPDGGECDDGEVCSLKSACQGGACAVVQPKPCDDANGCTKDQCVPGQGCKSSPIDGGKCDDNDTCTVGDVCVNGLCLGKKGAACDDGNACTLDKCDVKQGCVHLASTGVLCDDGDACTDKDVCAGGVCKSGTTLQCVDSQQCTQDGCDAATGKCVFEPLSDGECDDGNLCSLNDACLGGQCKAGPPPPCGDGNPCTTDNCDPKTGKCQHDVVSAGSACDDGNKCTSGGKCLGLSCTGVPKDCDDQQSCTLDTCAPSTGACGHQKLKDGATCKKKDGLGGLCKQGVCG